MSYVTNGRTRKSLEQQIDRLDSILDGLANALNEAVADAVKEAVGVAVQEAVQVALTQALSNPRLVRKVAEAHGLTAEPVKYSPVDRLAEKVANGWSRFSSMVARAWANVGSKAAGMTNAVIGRGAETKREVVRRVGSIVSSIGDRTRLIVALAPVLVTVARLHRRTAFVSAGVGLLAGVGSYLAGPLASSVACGTAGFVASIGFTLLDRVRSL